RPIRPHGLLLTQTSGHWTAAEAPLPANARSDLSADLLSVSCASAGNCTAVGAYIDSSNNQQGLLLTQTSGNWATGVKAPLPAASAPAPAVALRWGSCRAPGSSPARRTSLVRPGRPQGLLLTQTSGHWTAAEAPVPANAAPDPGVVSNSVSCGSAGNCTAVGN